MIQCLKLKNKMNKQVESWNLLVEFDSSSSHIYDFLSTVEIKYCSNTVAEVPTQLDLQVASLSPPVQLIPKQPHGISVCLT